MTIEEALLTFIQTNVPAAGLGYPIQVPGDAAIPAWSYQVVDDDQHLAHDRATGFRRARIQLDLMAKAGGGKTDYANAKAIKNAIVAALDGYRGPMSGLSVDYCHATTSDDWADVHQLPVQRLDVLLSYR